MASPRVMSLPVFDGDLAGDDGRGATVAIIEDLEKVARAGRIENRQPQSSSIRS